MNIIDTLTDVTKGTAAGTVAGPIGAAIGGLGSLVIDIAPEISRWLFGSKDQALNSLVARSIETVTGTADAQAAQDVLERDPVAVSQLRMQLAMIAAQRQTEADRTVEAQRAADLAAVQATMADRTGARKQTEMLTQMRSKIAWAPAILSAIILISFGILIYVVLTQDSPAERSMPLANVLLGSLAAMATQVANYWLGSSSGSAAKSDQLAALSAESQASVPSEIVHRLLPPIATPMSAVSSKS